MGKDIIFIPDNTVKQEKDPQEINTKGCWENFSYSAFIGCRPKQEDTLVYLNGLENNNQLSVEQIGHRLWSAYRQLDIEFADQQSPAASSTGSALESSNAGTTASSIYYDGKGNIITANLGDSSAFAIVYGENRAVLKVVRLNSVTHKPTVGSREYKRIIDLGGTVENGRIEVGVNSVNVARAIGDVKFKKYICAEPTIDSTSVDEIISGLDGVVSVEVLVASDGLTDAAGRDQSKTGHENTLKECLEYDETKNMRSAELCSELIRYAIRKGSRDNISIAHLQIYMNGECHEKTEYIAAFDGHAGEAASVFAANNIGRVVRFQLGLSKADYANNDNSIYKHEIYYKRDHNISVIDEISNYLENKFLKKKVSRLLVNQLVDIHQLSKEWKQKNYCQLVCSELFECIKALESLDEESYSFQKDSENISYHINSMLGQLKEIAELQQNVERIANGFILLKNSIYIENARYIPRLAKQQINENVLEIWKKLSKKDRFYYSENFIDLAIAYPEELKEELSKLHQQWLEEKNELLIGLLYQYGLGVEKNHEKALEIFERKRKEGNLDAMIFLAKMYIYGQGVDTSPEKVIELLNPAADKENLDADSLLAARYLFRRSTTPQDRTKAFKLLESAKKKNNSDAMFNLGKLYMRGSKSLGLKKRDTYKAQEFFECAIKDNHSGAMLKLAMIVDMDKALNLVKMASDLGHRKVVYTLVMLRAKQRKQDELSLHDVKAIEIFNQEIGRGNPRAMYHLAEMYHEGKGAPKSLIEAKRLYQMAVDKGYKEAKEKLKDVKQQLETKGQPFEERERRLFLILINYFVDRFDVLCNITEANETAVYVDLTLPKEKKEQIEQLVKQLRLEETRLIISDDKNGELKFNIQLSFEDIELIRGLFQQPKSILKNPVENPVENPAMLLKREIGIGFGKKKSVSFNDKINQIRFFKNLEEQQQCELHSDENFLKEAGDNGSEAALACSSN